MEAADKSMRTFNAGKLNKLGTKGTGNLRKTSDPCYCCGRLNHKLMECKFKKAECHACGKTRHIATAFHSKPPRSKKAYPQKHNEQTIFLVRTQHSVKQTSAAKNLDLTMLRDALTQTPLLWHCCWMRRNSKWRWTQVWLSQLTQRPPDKLYFPLRLSTHWTSFWRPTPTNRWKFLGSSIWEWNIVARRRSSYLL